MIYKRNNRWWFRFQIRGMRYARPVAEATTKKQAMAAETRFKNELLQGKYDLVDAPKQDITFAQYAKKYLEWSKENKRSYTTDVWRIRVLTVHFGSKRPSDIAPIDVERFKVERHTGITRRGEVRSPASVNRELALLKHVLSHAQRDGLIRNHPMKGKVKLYREDNKIERYLTDEEETRLLSACVGRAEYLRPIIVTAIYTGMRRAEIFNLKWGDVDFKENTIHVRQSKSGRARTIPMTPNVRAEIEKMLPFSAEFEYVFGNPDTRLPRTDITDGFLVVCRRAGIQGLRFHDLRHTFATRLAAASGNLVDVAHVLGHSTIQTTMRYAHAIPQKVAEAMNKLAAPKAQVIPMPKTVAQGAK